MYIIKYLKSLLYILISIICFSIIIGTMTYFNILGNNSIKILELISIVMSMMIGGIYIGRKSSKKGYLEGTKIGLSVIIILFIFSYLAYNKSPSLTSLIFYIIIITSVILGSILGINKKSSN